MDRALEEPDLEAIHDALAEFERDGVRFHALRTRQAGSRRFVSLHVLVPGAWTVQRGHDLVERVEATLCERLPGASVFTHLEPPRTRARSRTHDRWPAPRRRHCEGRGRPGWPRRRRRGESNPHFRYAKPACSHYHYAPRSCPTQGRAARDRRGGGGVDVDRVAHVLGVAAGQHDAHAGARAAQAVEHELVAGAQAGLGEREAAEAVALPGVGAREVEGDVGLRARMATSSAS